MSWIESKDKTIYEPGSKRILLKSVDFKLEQGETVWLKGRNGLGKSLYMQSLMALCDEKLGISYSYFPQSLQAQIFFACTVADLLSVTQNVYQELIKGLDLNKHWNMLSGGERQRLGLALTCGAEAQVYFFDEPTNHLDVDYIAVFFNILESKMKNNKKSIVITHHASPSHWNHLNSIKGVRIVNLEGYLP